MAPRLTPGLVPWHLTGLRWLIALVWLYNGLVLKLWLLDPEHLAVVTAAFGLEGPLGLSPELTLRLIGAGETALAVAVASGRFDRPLAVVQIALITAMNLAGIVSGGVSDGVGLIVANLPLLALIALVGVYGVVDGRPRPADRETPPPPDMTAP